MLVNKIAEGSYPGIDLIVETFEDGPSFLEAVQLQEEYYTVLLDGVMPKMDGLEVLWRMKRDQVGAIYLYR